MANSQNIHIAHADDTGEQRIGNYRVDGFDEINNNVYEFQECFWHGLRVISMQIFKNGRKSRPEITL